MAWLFQLSVGDRNKDLYRTSGDAVYLVEQRIVIQCTSSRCTWLVDQSWLIRSVPDWYIVDKNAR